MNKPKQYFYKHRKFAIATHLIMSVMAFGFGTLFLIVAIILIPRSNSLYLIALPFALMWLGAGALFLQWTDDAYHNRVYKFTPEVRLQNSSNLN